MYIQYPDLLVLKDIMMHGLLSYWDLGRNLPLLFST